MSDTICLKARTGRPATGENYIATRFEERETSGRPLCKLTARQQEILQLLAKGFYYKEIGAALGISPFTVRAHLHTVYRKLDVKSRARAVVKFNEYVRQPQV